jgi:hypothetical protein
MTGSGEKRVTLESVGKKSRAVDSEESHLHAPSFCGSLSFHLIQGECCGEGATAVKDLFLKCGRPAL